MRWPFKRKSDSPLASSPIAPAPTDDEEPMVSFWTYFDEQDAAEHAAERLRAQNLAVEARPTSDGRSRWLVLAFAPLTDSEEDVERNCRIVKSVAGSLQGTYDGWEAGPIPDDATERMVTDWLKRGVGAT